MSKTKQQKQTEVSQLENHLIQAKSTVFTSFSGLTVAESQELRRKLRQEGVAFQVSKKTLLKKILEEQNFPAAEVDKLKNNIGVAFGKGDEIAPAKILSAFSKDHEKLQISFGILEGQIIDFNKIKELANLPSRIELVAKVVGSIKAPLTGVVNVLAGNLRGLVNVLKAIKEKEQS